MTIWISREPSLIYLVHLGILCAWLGHPCEKLWPFEILESLHCSISSISICYVPESDILVKCYDRSNFSRGFVDQFRASRYIMRQNGTSVWKLMTIWISWELPLFNFKRLDMLCAWIGNPNEKLWLLEFLESFSCSISSVSIYYVPEWDVGAKSYDHMNFSRAFEDQFWASRYVLCLNRSF